MPMSSKCSLSLRFPPPETCMKISSPHSWNMHNLPNFLCDRPNNISREMQTMC
jgi:hypothetical protein